MMKRLELSLLVAGLALLLSACGGGGGGGGATGGGNVPVTPPVVDTPPARVGDLALTEGTSFNSLRLTFTAPSGAAGGSYQLRYRAGALDDASFASAPALPAGIAIPAPGAAGATETVTVDAALLAAVEPGGSVHFALRALSAGGAASTVSNDVATTRPWYLTLRFTRRDNPALEPAVARVGAQTGAVDALDGFDAAAPPALPGGFVARVTLAGRAEALLRDIRAPFGAAGESETWTVALLGAANQPLTLDFPSLVETTPMYVFKVGGIESYEVEVSGAALDLTLDGTGARTITVKASN